jgi:alginate O-acetyltransferase complex protein AlgI
MKARNGLLLGASLVFYAFGDVWNLPILLVSIVINYFVSMQIGKKTSNAIRGGKTSKQGVAKQHVAKQHVVKQHGNVSRRRKLLLSRDFRPLCGHLIRSEKRPVLFILAFMILINVAVLVLCKALCKDVGIPLGMSFYTFQIISYLVDCYRGECGEKRNFLHYANAIVMFPKLISGPIVRYKDLAGSLESMTFSAEQLQQGLITFIYGLAMKVLLADPIGLIWNEAQVTGFESLSTIMTWLVAGAYSLHLYFDFCGYSIMAMGLGQMMGFTLPKNFHHPYLARSIRAFYRRWHITLGNWFRDYVYIPLGGSKKGEIRTWFSLLVVWTLTGLWHGFTWNFMLWSGILYILIVIERILGKAAFWKQLTILPHVYVLMVIPITWMCFAIQDMADLQIYLGRMFGYVDGINVNTLDWVMALKRYWVVLVAGVVVSTPIVEKLYERLKKHLWGQIIIGLLFWLCLWQIWKQGANVFRYSQF